MQIWYVEVRISRSIPECPLDFEITRVDCICIYLSKVNGPCPCKQGLDWWLKQSNYLTCSCFNLWIKHDCALDIIRRHKKVFFQKILTGADSERVQGIRSVETPIWLKSSFSLEILDKFGIPYLLWISTSFFTLYFSSTSSFYNLWMSVKLLDKWQTV